MSETFLRIGTLAHVVWREMIRRKDIYVLLILLIALLAYLLGMEFFGSKSAVRYIAESGLLLSWLFSWILTITIAARQLPSEERRGTIFPLLAKPISRAELIIGKWLGAWMAACAGTGLFYACVVGVVFLRGGELSLATFAQGYILHVGLLSILSALALSLSTRLNSDAASTLSCVISIVCFLLVPKVPEMLMYADGISALFVKGLYWSLPHFEFFDMRRRIVHGWGLAPRGAFFGSVTYAVLWTAMFLGLAWLSYRRKLFNRELLG